MDENKIKRVVNAWNKHLETRLIIRVCTDTGNDGAGGTIDRCDIRILSFDEATPAGSYYIQYSQEGPHRLIDSEPFFQIDRLISSTQTPVEQVIADMRISSRPSFYSQWIDERPFLLIQKGDRLTTSGEHLNIHAYSQMTTLHTLLQCRARFNFKSLNNEKVLIPTIRKLGAFLSAERANLAKIRSMF